MNDWKNGLAPTSECIAIERLGSPLTSREREHVAHCARCQSEMALWNEFENNEVRAEDEADVQAIADELRRSKSADARQSSNVVAFRPRTMRMLAIAATLVIAIAVGYIVENREPSVNVPVGESAYRSAAVELIAPKGDLASAPSTLQWHGVASADEYDVAVFEVDHTLLWRDATSETKVNLPSSVAGQFVPGKTIVWQVTARRDASTLAQSVQQKFRVKP